MTRGDFAEAALSYQKQLWNAALRLVRERAEAENAFQETYRRAFEHAGELRSLAHGRTWLFRILTTLVIDGSCWALATRTRLAEKDVP